MQLVAVASPSKYYSDILKKTDSVTVVELINMTHVAKLRWYDNFSAHTDSFLLSVDWSCRGISTWSGVISVA